MTDLMNQVETKPTSHEIVDATIDASLIRSLLNDQSETTIFQLFVETIGRLPTPEEFDSFTSKNKTENFSTYEDE
jgi:hypothetical protein